jgi:hypothetical protein
MQGKLNEGLDWLQSKSHLWVDLCSFMVTHNHFHIVLNCLDLGKSVYFTVLLRYSGHLHESPFNR